MLAHTTLRIVTQPKIEPVEPEQTRRHCRIDYTDNDDLLEAYITTSRILAEQFLNRALITQALLYTILPINAADPNWLGLGLSLCNVNGENSIARTYELPRGPVQSVTSLKLRDTLGVDYTIASAIDPFTGLPGYEVDLTLEPSRLRIEATGINQIIAGNSLFTPPLQHLAVQYVAGYGDTMEMVPQPIRMAIMFNVAWMYEHRGDADIERGLSKVAESLLSPYRLISFGG